MKRSYIHIHEPLGTGDGIQLKRVTSLAAYQRDNRLEAVTPTPHRDGLTSRERIRRTLAARAEAARSAAAQSAAAANERPSAT